MIQIKIFKIKFIVHKLIKLDLAKYIKTLKLKNI